jgi:hypothetical protein
MGASRRGFFELGHGVCLFALALVLVGGLGIAGACLGSLLFNLITTGQPLS